MPYNAGRGGHAPGHIRELFCGLIDSGELDDELTEGRPERTERWLIGQLWNCSDTMPSDLCAEVGLPAGSTYAQAVRARLTD